MSKSYRKDKRDFDGGFYQGEQFRDRKDHKRKQKKNRRGDKEKFLNYRDFTNY